MTTPPGDGQPSEQPSDSEPTQPLYGQPGAEPTQPLSGQRCLTRRAAEQAGYAPRFGVEVGLTIDLLRAGYRVAEVPADLRHRVTGEDWRSQMHRARQYRDVLLALRSRSLPPRNP